MPVGVEAYPMGWGAASRRRVSVKTEPVDFSFIFNTEEERGPQDHGEGRPEVDCEGEDISKDLNAFLAGWKLSAPSKEISHSEISN